MNWKRSWWDAASNDRLSLSLGSVSPSAGAAREMRARRHLRIVGDDDAERLAWNPRNVEGREAGPDRLGIAPGTRARAKLRVAPLRQTPAGGKVRGRDWT